VRHLRFGPGAAALAACAVVLVAAACAMLVGCAKHASHIALQNQMSGEVTHVKITWDGGGEQHFDIVAPQQTVTVTMTHVTTKGFTLEMTLPDGKKYERQIPTSFAPDYSGGVKITVEADGRVGWEEHFEHR